MHRLFTPEGGDAEPVFRIGLQPIRLADWFEGGEDDPAARKAPLLQSNPAEVWGEVEGSRPAQAEAAHMITGWLGRAPSASGLDTLWDASLLVPDDLCLMEKRHGAWTLTAASLCAPSFFSAAEAVGKPLAGLHDPVPGFNDGFHDRVARIFDAIRRDVIVERRNWSLVTSSDLFLPSAEPLRSAAAGQTPEEIGSILHVRRERQTIRRLPRSEAILFTIRIWIEPLGALLADPARRNRFAEAWARLMSEEGRDFRTYKRLDLFDDAVRRLLEAPI